MYQEIGVGTPAPVGYLNVRKGLLFDRSYYVTLASTCPYVYNDLFYQHFDYADEVVRTVGRVTAVLHEHGYAHKDYGRGNIQKRRHRGLKAFLIILILIIIVAGGGAFAYTARLRYGPPSRIK
mgnify:CR=1 FL=1